MKFVRASVKRSARAMGLVEMGFRALVYQGVTTR
jgi:hypothetical protein